ncbi:MAG: hypothetical protein ABSE59_00600 [Opitutaceae bacterium]
MHPCESIDSAGSAASLKKVHPSQPTTKSILSRQRENQSLQEMQPIRVQILLWKIGAVMAILLLGTCSVGAFVSEAYFAALLFAVSTSLSILLLVAYGPVELNSTGIEMIAPRGVYAMRWDEIMNIRYSNSHIVFAGENKRLTVPNPFFWRGKNRMAAIEALGKFCRDAAITPKRSVAAEFLLSKNARRASPKTPR